MSEERKGGDFTSEGYNNRSRSCLDKDCDGKIYPTLSENVGKCDTCEKKFKWYEFLRK